MYWILWSSQTMGMCVSTSIGEMSPARIHILQQYFDGRLEDSVHVLSYSMWGHHAFSRRRGCRRNGAARLLHHAYPLAFLRSAFTTSFTPRRICFRLEAFLHSL